MYNPRVIKVQIVLPDGYYDEDDDVSTEGLLMVQEVLEEAGIDVEVIEQ